MTVINKWTGKLYTIVSTNETDNTTTLERDNGSQFTIQKSQLMKLITLQHLNVTTEVSLQFKQKNYREVKDVTKK